MTSREPDEEVIEMAPPDLRIVDNELAAKVRCSPEYGKEAARCLAPPRVQRSARRATFEARRPERSWYALGPYSDVAWISRERSVQATVLHPDAPGVLVSLTWKL